MFVPPPPSVAVPPPPPSAVVPPPPPSAAVPPPPPPSAVIPIPPPSAVVPPPPPSVIVPPPPPSVIVPSPPPPSAVIPIPPPSAVVPPPPPSAVVPPPPPSVIVPPPPPSTVIPIPPPSAVVPPPPPSAVVPPPPLSVIVPPPPPSTVIPIPPPSAVIPVPPPSAVVPPPSASIPSVPPATSVTFIPHPPTASGTTNLTSSVPVKPSVPPTTTITPEIASAKPISLEKWNNIETKARTRIPDQTHTRYLHVDEVIRDNVGNLFVQSKYDVLTLLTNIVNSLQQFGRHDVCLMRNANNTAFTIMQHSAHGLYSGIVNDPSSVSSGREGELVEQKRREMAYAIERINQAGSFYTSRLAELDHSITQSMQTNASTCAAINNPAASSYNKEASNNKVNPSITSANQRQEGIASAASQTTMYNPVFEKTVYEKIMEKIARREQRRLRQQRAESREQHMYDSTHSSVSNTYLLPSATPSSLSKLSEHVKARNRKSNILIDSYNNNSSSGTIKSCNNDNTLSNSYNGNYILNRYGRSYNPEKSYSHYKYYGLPKVV